MWARQGRLRCAAAAILIAFVAASADEHVHVLSDGVEGQAGVEHPGDLGESAGTTDDDRLIDQTSSIDKEVSQLGAEVAALENDHSAPDKKKKGDEDAAPIPSDDPDADTPAKKKKKKSSEQKELRSAADDTATTEAEAPPPPP